MWEEKGRRTWREREWRKKTVGRRTWGKKDGREEEKGREQKQC